MPVPTSSANLSALQSTGLCKRILAMAAEWSQIIRIEHTIFALPFALSGLILAGRVWPTGATWFWTIMAFGSARAAAMAMNRLIDKEIDRRNQRTSMRAIACGRVKQAQAVLFIVFSFLTMIYSASHLPPICLWLSPIAVAWLTLYSYTKRFTCLCHLALGVALSGGALGGWLAGGGSLGSWSPWLMASAVAFWVAGFDIIYACQDVDFDLTEGLFSIPSRFGVGRALTVSSAFHLITVLCLLGLGGSLQLGPIYFGGLALVTAVLIYEHRLVHPHDLSRLNDAFFAVNGVISVVMFVSIWLDKAMA